MTLFLFIQICILSAYSCQPKWLPTTFVLREMYVKGSLGLGYIPHNNTSTTA